jgi:16S rRNA (guanine(966)-N(2))-methyltransferase RsmD
LKIIAGTEKGRLLKTLKINNFSIRPTLARIKKSVFDIIKFKIKDSIFIDLFAGVGSIGIEALSRGAKKAVFVDINNNSLSLIKYNINKLGFNNKSNIIKCDLSKKIPNLCDIFDIVFIGPPYYESIKHNLTYTVLKNIYTANILNDNSIIISQNHIKERVEFIDGIECFRTKKYGYTMICFYRIKKIINYINNNYDT